MKSSAENPFLQPLSGDLDKISGTSKSQRDQWWTNFWQYLDQNPDTGQIMRRWQQAGCDPRNIALAIHRYAIFPNTLNEQRKSRGKRARKILKAANRSLNELVLFHRAYGQNVPADRFAEDEHVTEELLSRSKRAFSTKKFGMSRSWMDLAMIEGFVFESTRARPTPSEIVNLIKAGRRAASQEPDVWETSAEVIRKGLKNFKKNNPFYSQVWNSPSKLSSN